MFNQKHIRIKALLNTIGVPLVEHGKVLAYAVATAIASNGPLPSSPVDSPSGYYADNVAASFNSLISEFNENIIIDVSLASATARSLWTLRYQTVHTPLLALYSKKWDFFCGFTGVELVFSDQDYVEMTKYKKEILSLALAILESNGE